MATPEDPPLEEPRRGPAHTDVPVLVGIGASSGGLAAAEQFFGTVEPGAGLAYAFVQHLHPQHESLLPQLIGRFTSLPARHIVDGMEIEADVVYVIPPGKYAEVVDGQFSLVTPLHPRGMRLPIDFFFRSMAASCRERCVAVVLSGAGGDGSLGIASVKAAGGLVLAQSTETAEYDSMPIAAIESGMVDEVLEAAAMFEIIQRFASHTYLKRRPSTEIDKVTDSELDDVLAEVHKRTAHDFRYYKRATLIRRIQRRMGLHDISSWRDYVRFLQDSPENAFALDADFMIGVTSFFREPSAFAALREFVVEPLLDRRAEGDAIRIWTPGCSTGAEAYSLAIVFNEAFAKRGEDVELQIFATDIDTTALAVARTGVYPGGIAADIPPYLLDRYFVPTNGNYRVTDRPRNAITFAEQNMLKDPPFSRLDLVCCRNLLIYLKPEIQRRVLSLFHFALKPDGYLFLGQSETIGRRMDLFHPLAKKHRVYARNDTARPARISFPISLGNERAPSTTGTRFPSLGPRSKIAELMRDTLVDSFAPPSVLVNRRGEALHYHGDLKGLLQIQPGDATSEVVELVPSWLRAIVLAVLHRGFRERNLVTAVAKAPATGGQVRVSVRPVGGTHASSGLFLVGFDTDAELVPEQLPQGALLTDHSTNLQLEKELHATRSDLQSMVEELETSNEELRASNEEVMSMNEELKSSNEGLELTKEESQALNEELSTINTQLQVKISELETANNDLDNMNNSTRIPTVFLDRRLHIRRFTPATRLLLRMIPSDVGRPLADLSRQFDDSDLISDAEEVLTTLGERQREVRAHDNRWYLRRILPYRTHEDRISGAVVTFTEITALKRANLALALQTRQQALSLTAGPKGVDPEVAVALVESALSDALENLGMSAAVLFEFNQGEQGFLRQLGTPLPSLDTPDFLQEIAKLRGHTTGAADTLAVHEVDNDSRLAGMLMLDGYRALLAAQVSLGRDSWCVLVFLAHAPRSFTEGDLRFVRSLVHASAAGLLATRSRAGNHAE